MYKVGVTGNFYATHSMSGDVPPEEKVPHRHAYRLEWTFRVVQLDERGFSLDISVLERLRDELFKDLTDTVLNDIPWFAGKTTSLEYLCAYVFEMLRIGVEEYLGSADSSRIDKMEIKVWENDHAWAGIEGVFSQERSA